MAEDEELPEHTQSMRQAARYCLSGLQRVWLFPGSASPLGTTTTSRNVVDDNCDDSSSTIALCRHEAYTKFWATDAESSTATYDPGIGVSTATNTAHKKIPEIQYSDLSSPTDFRRRFHDTNLPCLVTFENHQEWFGTVNSLWRRLGSERPQGHRHQTVNRNWFVETLGAETKLPVRFQPPGDSSSALLDEEGRATECETKQVSVAEWIQMLDQHQAAEHHDVEDADATCRKNPYYLKDWHLLSQLQGQQNDECLPATVSHLYECPPIFEFDLLNSFLTRFTKGDYRFCYWGPKGSFTSRHSDVLHSFSWSYNVIGTKQWTFFKGMLRGSEDDDSDDACYSEPRVTVVQKAGQAMFVPSQWQHEVVNLEETISINHNWMTSANLDLCWECLTTEMVAIDKELDAWDIHDNAEARESMLRGCVGLDVTAFFLMTLVRLTDLLTHQLEESSLHAEDDPTDEEPSSSMGSERATDVHRLLQMIQVVRQAEFLQLEARLESVLQSNILTMELLNVTDKIV